MALTPDQLSFDLPLPAEGLTQLWTPIEIYERLNADNVRQFLEDRRIEHKSTGVQPKALAEYLSMWSNTQPHGGLIIVGINDNGAIDGCNAMSQSHKNNLENLTHLCPDARWASKAVGVKNGNGEDDFNLVFQVSYRPDKVVETSGSEAFIREGDKKLRISETLKRELRISRGEIHYELEKVSLKYPQDFDADEISKFCSAFFVNRRFTSAKTRDELLELAKLGRRLDGHFEPNLACALLFAPDPRDVIPGARIRLIRYEGKHEKFGEEMNSVYSTLIDGNISKLLFDAKPVIAAQLRSFQRFTKNGRIAVQQEYPEEAWFEAVVNAVAHRSYNLKTQNIFVKIFDDKFVVESPGAFVPPTTATTVYDAHNPRNPYLMEAMMHLELTFCGFEGTRRMRQAMKVAKLPEPRFRQIEAHSHQVHVTLENRIDTRKALPPEDPVWRITEVEASSLTETEIAVLNFPAKVNEVNITNATLVIGKSWPTTSKVIAGLVDKDCLELAEKGARKHDSNKAYRIRQK